MALGNSWAYAGEPASGARPGVAPSASGRPNLTAVLPWRNPNAMQGTASPAPGSSSGSVSVAAMPTNPTPTPAAVPVSPAAPVARTAHSQTPRGTVVQASSVETVHAPASNLRPAAVMPANPMRPQGSGIARTVFQQSGPPAFNLPTEAQDGTVPAAPPVLPPSAAPPSMRLPDVNPGTPEPPRIGEPAPRIPSPAAPKSDGFGIPNQEPTPAPIVPEPQAEPAAPPAAMPESNVPNIPNVPNGENDSPLRSPSDQNPQTPSPLENPFRRDRREPPVEPTEPDSMDLPDVPESPDGMRPMPRPNKNSLTCDDLRARVRERTIDRISLDISPPFRPDIIDAEKLDTLRADFLKKQRSRVWRDIQGQPLAEGALQDIEFDHVVLRGAGGRSAKIPLSQLGEPELEYLAEAWGLPRACRLEQEPYAGRQWEPMTFTWKASGLCHKPLYFEEVQLERYGHSTGPFLQPVLSSAHFFVNIAVLPYKMGIHPPSECQYALGYYRPGNCAPWMIPPIPLSLRGAITQGAVVGGGIALIP